MELSIKADLSKQVAIVTGASQGLGKAVAVALGMNGAKVVCLARNADKLQETVAAIEAAGGSVATINGQTLAYGKTAAAYLNPHFVAWGRTPLLVRHSDGGETQTMLKGQ